MQAAAYLWRIRHETALTAFAPELIKKTLHALNWLLFLVPHGLLNTAVLERIRLLTGGCLRGTVSGGGALPPDVDEFFNVLGIPILEGYGMTEVPVIAVRKPEHLVLGTVGPILPNMELRLVDLNTGEEICRAPQSSNGRQGEIQVRGPQVTAGYFANDEATANALQDGWWKTGDIGIISHDGALRIAGRCKDTIVLASGENVEPVPIEDRLRRSPLIGQCVVVGQDQKHLGVLVIPDPEAFEQHENLADIAADQTAQAAIKQEVQQLISTQQGFKRFELIQSVALLPKAFEVGDELTNLKLRRHVIHESYADEIASLYTNKETPDHGSSSH